MLSVQASPGVMGAPGAAMQQFGQVVTNESLKWLEKLVKEERDTELAANANKFDKSVATTQEEVSAISIKDWTATSDRSGQRREQYLTPIARWNFIEGKLLNEATKQSNSISSSAVRRNFMILAHKRIAGIRPGTMSILRGKHADFQKAEINKSAFNDSKRLAHAGAGTPLRAELEAEIRTTYEVRGRIGNLKKSVIEAKIRKVFSEADELEIDRRFGAENVTPADLAALHSDIFEGKKYKWLSSSAQGRLATRADKRHDSVTRAAINAELKAENATAKKLKREQDTFFDTKTADLNKIRSRENRGVSPDEPMPTVADVNEWHFKRKIRKDHRDKLIENINGEDNIENTEFVNFLRQDIRDAVTESDLTLLQESVRDAHMNRLIGGKANSLLLSYIDGAKRKTPQFIERGRYEKLLGVALSPKLGIIARSLPGGQSDLRMPEAQWADYYHSQVDNGVRPQAAYLAALELGGNVRKENIRAEILKMDPAVIKAFGATGFAKVTPEFVNNLNMVDVDNARSTWRRWAHGEGMPLGRPRSVEEMQALQFGPDRDDRITKAERMTARRLYAMERQINFVAAWVAAKQPEGTSGGADTSGAAGTADTTGGAETSAQRRKRNKNRGKTGLFEGLFQ